MTNTEVIQLKTATNCPRAPDVLTANVGLASPGLEIKQAGLSDLTSQNNTRNII